MSDTTKYLYIAFLKYNASTGTLSSDLMTYIQRASSESISNKHRDKRRVRHEGRDFVKRFRWKK